MKDKSVLSFEALQRAADSKSEDGSQMILSTLWETVTEESAPIEDALRRVARTASETANSVRKSVFQMMLGRSKPHQSGKPASVALAVDFIRSLCEELIESPSQASEKRHIGERNKSLESDVLRLQKELNEARSELKSVYAKYLTNDEIRLLASMRGTSSATEELVLLATRSYSSSRRTHRFDDSNRCERCGMSISDLASRRVHQIIRSDGKIQQYSGNDVSPRPSLLFCSGIQGTAVMAGITDDIGLY